MSPELRCTVTCKFHVVARLSLAAFLQHLILAVCTCQMSYSDAHVHD